MDSTIPKKALVALDDFSIVPPEQAKVSAFDRSFHFGDSLYEVLRTYNGILFSLDNHLQRLEQSARLALFEVPINTQHITEQVRKVCKAYFQKFGNHDVYVRIIVSRGAGDLNIDRRTSSAPYSLVFVKEFQAPTPEQYEKGVHYAIVTRHRNLITALSPAMKSGNYLNNILAMAEARAMGADDAVLLNYQGFATEGTTNNIYIVRQKEIWTPPLSVGILAGITRDWIFQICKKIGISIQERLFTAQDMHAANEMFLSSTIKEVMPITKVSNQVIGSGQPGPMTCQLHQEVRHFIAQYCKTHDTESLYI